MPATCLRVPVRSGQQSRLGRWKFLSWNPDTEPFCPPPADARPIPGLVVHRGYECSATNCQYTARAIETLRAHRRKVYGPSPIRRGE